MASLKKWINNHKPSQRRLIQLYSALLYNAHIKGYITGDIYVGNLKVVCVPGLNCYSCPGAIGACPLGALQNALASSGHRAPFFVLGIILIYGITLGRTICGYLCPVGLVQELLHKIPSPKLKKNKITKVLSYLKYIILAVLVIIIPLWYSLQNYPVPAFCKYICPAGTMEGAVGLLSNPENADKLSMLGILFTRKFIILTVLVVSSIFIYRVFCRFICPLGALYGLFAKVSVIGVKVNASKCTDCGRCISKCPVDIRKVGDAECVNCGKCIGVCPTKAIEFKVGKHTINKQQNNNKKFVMIWVFALLILAASIFISNVDFSKDSIVAETPIEEASKYSIPEEVASLPIGMEVGMRAPDFSVELYNQEGSSFTLSDYLGQKVVINFWATWCAPCIAELPHFDQFSINNPDVKVIAIHSHLITDSVENYLSNYDYSMDFGQDENGSVIKAFGGSTMLPHTIILDENGVIEYNSVGAISYEKLESLLF